MVRDEKLREGKAIEAREDFGLMNRSCAHKAAKTCRSTAGGKPTFWVWS